MPTCTRTDQDTRQPTVFPGWNCCRCRRYNPFSHYNCEKCGHDACYTINRNETLPVRTKDMAQRSMTIYVDAAPTARIKVKTNV